uniref:VWFA domain-containing protein n=1 Tax=Oryza brachyantha TaxID=4533 RepID=J3LJV7_ORYBR
MGRPDGVVDWGFFSDCTVEENIAIISLYGTEVALCFFLVFLWIDIEAQFILVDVHRRQVLISTLIFSVHFISEGQEGKPCSQPNAPTNSIFIVSLQVSTMATTSAQYVVLSGKKFPSRVLNLQTMLMEDLELSRGYSGNLQEQLAVFRTPETSIFNDDENIDLQSETAGEHNAVTGSVEIKTYSEFPAIQQSVRQQVFSILIHLKAPKYLDSMSSRAPLDLVTVLDVSGSMSGIKLALLKRAMSFVIQTLGPNDRLSVIAFSSTARRLFPLRRMTLTGRQQALQAISSLVASGGTNIAEGLKKGAKVVEDRRLKNSVCSIILLSDGQDTHTFLSSDEAEINYSTFVPPSILPGTGHHVQIHTFGFGTDHDSAAMHAIAEISNGTFSFIDAEGSIQDAFAQCIGGLLSVVVKDMRLCIKCIDEGVSLTSIKSGSYASQVARNERSGSVDIGDLYADEERGFLITLHVPAAQGQTVLIKPTCTYLDAITMENIQLNGEEVTIQRPAYCVDCEMSPEVEREWHRAQTTEDMSAARSAAEDGFFPQAVSILESRRRILEFHAAQSSDSQFLALIKELREMQDRVESRQRYEESGRAYMLSGLSSHSWQRATARGDSTELTTLIHTYQTPSMVDMLQRSQTILPSVVEMLNPSPTVTPPKYFSSHLPTSRHIA